MKIFKNLAFLALGVFGLYSCEKSIQDFGKVDFLGADDVIVKINMASIYPMTAICMSNLTISALLHSFGDASPFPAAGIIPVEIHGLIF